MVDIVVVDDDPIVGQLTTDLLREAGFDSHLLTNGKEVIDFCKKNNIEFKHGTRLEFVEGYIGLNDQLYILGTAADNPYKKEATSHRSTEDIMIQSKIASPFYISTNHEKAVLKRIKKNTIICFLLGMSLTLLGLGIILDTFNLL